VTEPADIRPFQPGDRVLVVHPIGHTLHLRPGVVMDVHPAVKSVEVAVDALDGTGVELGWWDVNDVELL
jgi:hypothetical protein